MATPQEILAGAINPLAASVNEYASTPVAIEQARYINALKNQTEMAQMAERARLMRENELAVQALRNRGETERTRMTIDASKERNDADNKAAMERTREQVRAYIDRLSEAEKLKEAQELSRYAGPRKPNETVDAYLERAHTEAADKIAVLLDQRDEQVRAIEDAKDTLKQGELKRQNDAARAMVTRGFAAEMAKLADPRGQAVIAAWIQKGRSVAGAIDEALRDKAIPPSVATELKSKLSEITETSQTAASNSVSREYLAAADKLERQHRDMLTGRDALMKGLPNGLLSRAEYLRMQRKNSGNGLSIPSGSSSADDGDISEGVVLPSISPATDYGGARGASDDGGIALPKPKAKEKTSDGSTSPSLFDPRILESPLFQLSAPGAFALGRRAAGALVPMRPAPAAPATNPGDALVAPFAIPRVNTPPTRVVMPPPAENGIALPPPSPYPPVIPNQPWDGNGLVLPMYNSPQLRAR